MIPGNGVGILGIGTALPARIVENVDRPRLERSQAPGDVLTSARDEWASGRGDPDGVAERMKADAADRSLGVRERRVLEDDRMPSDLEAEAARNALSDAGVDAREVALLMTFSHLSDYAAPQNHGLVADKLGLHPSVLALTVDREGASFIAQLELASRWLQATNKRALLVQSCVASRLLDHDQPSARVLSDAATAVVLGPVDDGYGFVAATHTTRGRYHAAARLAPRGSAEAPWYRGDDHRARLIYQAMDPELAADMGRALPGISEEVLTPLLSGAGLRGSDIALFVANEPTSWATELFANKLGIPADRCHGTYRTHGYPLGASVTFNLAEAVRQGRPRRGDHVVAWCMGPGYVGSGAVLRWA